MLAEEAEVTSLVAAPAARVRLVQAAMGPAASWALGRAELDVALDAAGHRVRDRLPRLTSMPKELHTGEPAAMLCHRFRLAETPPVPVELPDWWPNPDDPLVYMTLGSEAPGIQQ